MKIIAKILITGWCLLAYQNTFAQFTMSGEIRPRMEYLHGYKNLADSSTKAITSTSQRTRLNFDYKKGLKCHRLNQMVMGIAERVTFLGGRDSTSGVGRLNKRKTSEIYRNVLKIDKNVC